MRTALLVIDMQEGALDGCADAGEVIERVNELSRRASEAGAPVILVQHEDGDELVRDSHGW